MDIHIGLLGFGTVGSAVAEYLTQKQSQLQQRTNHTIALRSIYTRTQAKVKNANLGNYLVDDVQSIIQDEKINCIIELMGGVEGTKEIVIQALQAKKHVITANKALLAHHGKELFTLAKKHKVSISFEASCAGGIPIIKALTEGLVANQHSAIYGVLNGTCNFILTEMNTKEVSFETALHTAQALGLSEADPTLDIEGFDAAHKIVVLSSLGFNINVDITQVPITGINKVQNKDIHFGKKLSYTMKLVAASIITNTIERECLSIWVHPVFLPNNHPMTHIEGSFNGISIIGDEVGHTFYYGRGAGSHPTNSAVISDVIALSNESYPAIFDTIVSSYSYQSSLQQTGISQLKASGYIRVLVLDNPGTLAKITHIFLQHAISIARVLQEDVMHMPSHLQAHSKTALAELIIITHITLFSNIQNAAHDINLLQEVVDEASIYPIIEVPSDHLD